MTSYQRKGDDGGSEAHPHSLREEVSARVGEAQEAADAARREVGEVARRTSDEGARFVRENPGLALAGAVGFGVLIGLALRGRY